MYKITYIPDGITVLGQSFIAEKVSPGGSHSFLHFDELYSRHDWNIANYCSTPLFYRTQDNVPEVYNVEFVGAGDDYTNAPSETIENIAEDKVFIVSATIAHSGNSAPIAFIDSPRLMFESGFSDYSFETYYIENIPNTVFRADPERLPCNIPYAAGDCTLAFEGWAIDNSLALYKPGETCNSVNNMTIIAQAVWRDKSSGEMFLPKGTYYFNSDTYDYSYSGPDICFNSIDISGTENVYPTLMFQSRNYQSCLHELGFDSNRIERIVLDSDGLCFVNVIGGSYYFSDFSDYYPCLYLPVATRVPAEVFEIFSQICTYYPPFYYPEAANNIMPCSTIYGCWRIPENIITNYEELHSFGANEIVKFHIHSEYNAFTEELRHINFGSPLISSGLLVATEYGLMFPIVDSSGWVDSNFLASDGTLILDFGNVPQAVSPLFWYWFNSVAEFISNNVEQGSIITVQARGQGDYINVTSNVPAIFPDGEIYYQVYLGHQLLNETWWAPYSGGTDVHEFSYDVCELPIPPYVSGGVLNVVAAVPCYDDVFGIPNYQLYISANSGLARFIISQTSLRDVPAPSLILYDDILHVAIDDRMSNVDIYVNDAAVVASSLNVNYPLSELGIDPAADVYEVYADATAYTPYRFGTSQSNTLTIGSVPIIIDVSRSKNYVILDTLNKLFTKNVKLRLVDEACSATTQTVNNPIKIKLLRNTDSLVLKTKDTICENYIKVELVDPPVSPPKAEHALILTWGGGVNSVTVTRTASQNTAAPIGVLSPGDPIYTGDQLTIAATPQAGYTLKSFTTNWTVSNDISINISATSPASAYSSTEQVLLLPTGDKLQILCNSDGYFELSSDIEHLQPVWNNAHWGSCSISGNVTADNPIELYEYSCYLDEEFKANEPEDEASILRNIGKYLGTIWIENGVWRVGYTR